jgi:riboflavin biosynthesis pyrimidine reductase
MSLATPARDASGLQPLEAVYEASGLPAFSLPDDLVTTYGGSLGFTEPRLYANFVASLDGVVAIPGERQSSHLIAAGCDADRFVMGLLRAFADVVLIGAKTLGDSPRTRWTAADAYPPAADLYAEVRRQRRRPPQPALAVLSGSGQIDGQHPGLSEHAMILTSETGAMHLARRLPGSAAIVPIGDSAPLDPRAAIETLRRAGHGLILCEGGPTVFGALVADGLVDELFLTISPLLAGRLPRDARPALIEGAELLPGLNVAGRLLSLRRSSSHLFLRYALTRPEVIAT